MTRTRNSILALATVVCVAGGLSSQAVTEPGPFGYWLTESGKAIVEVTSCKGSATAVCGQIVWLSNPRDASGALKTDRNNPDPARRSDELCMVELLQALKEREDGGWGDGSIYNPRDGRLYAATMKVKGDRLHLRGYVVAPVFGKTQTWTRVANDRGGC